MPVGLTSLGWGCSDNTDIEKMLAEGLTTAKHSKALLAQLNVPCELSSKSLRQGLAKVLPTGCA